MKLVRILLSASLLTVGLLSACGDSRVLPLTEQTPAAIQLVSVTAIATSTAKFTVSSTQTGSLSSQPVSSSPSAFPSSPYVISLKAKGFNLPPDTVFKPLYSAKIQNIELHLVEYSSVKQGFKGIQVFDDQNQLFSPTDVTQATYVFTLIDRYTAEYKLPNFPANDRQQVQQMLVTLQTYRYRNRPLAIFAETVKPLLNLVDKGREIVLTYKTGPLKKFGITDIDVVDVICTIPVSAANLCLLEPVVRLIDAESPALDKTLDEAITCTTDFLAAFSGSIYSSDAKGLLDLTERTKFAYNELNERLASIEDKAQATIRFANKTNAFIRKYSILKMTQLDDLVVTPLANQAIKLSSAMSNLITQTQEAASVLNDWQIALDSARQEVLQLWRNRP